MIGCLGFATNMNKGDKFEPRVRRVVLLGYATSQKGYKMLDIESKTLSVSRMLFL